MISNHCCEKMRSNLGTDIAIKYIPKFREYGVLILDGGSSFQEIDFCPWCGSKLPDSLRDEWFEIVFDKMGLDSSDDPGVPENMKSDLWWIQGNID